ncbi:hypothetical protein [Aquamicrobium sp. LC103]|uniref:hypothetical protein n=1 Tax=Aquamicrobium sp. LC103 TaxID=1120658 RepID=UPI00063EAB94|nr:hypothetical protein [Aquamicrobium sp. LC103]TKT80030.1 hypothetical protein XW59_006625 [Aquamicrobium sp. LC103]
MNNKALAAALMEFDSGCDVDEAQAIINAYLDKAITDDMKKVARRLRRYLAAHLVVEAADLIEAQAAKIAELEREQQRAEKAEASAAVKALERIAEASTISLNVATATEAMNAVRAIAKSALTQPAAPQEADDWHDDPSADERWNAGLDFGMKQLCAAVGVDPDAVMWDAATETLDGDVQSVIWNILRARFGEDFPAAPQEAEVVVGNVAEAILLRVRKFIVAEHRHVHLLSDPKTEFATSRDETDLQHAQLTAFSVAQVDRALRIVRKRYSPPAQAVTEAQVEAATSVLLGRVNAPEAEVYAAARAALAAAQGGK